MAEVAIVRGSIVQGVVDEIVELVIPTELGVVDQKTIWILKELQVQWAGMENIQSRASQNLYGVITLSRRTQKHHFLDGELLAMIDWTCLQASANGGGMTYVDALKRYIFPDQPGVANSSLFIRCATNSLAQSTFNYRLFYELAKVSELDFIKMQSGYCVC